jgi:hypothetical protein
MSLVKQQYVVTQTVYQTEIPAFLDSWVTNTPFVKEIASPYIFLKKHNILKHWSIKDKSSFSVSYKIVYQWGTTNCYFMSSMAL